MQFSAGSKKNNFELDYDCETSTEGYLNEKVFECVQKSLGQLFQGSFGLQTKLNLIQALNQQSLPVSFCVINKSKDFQSFTFLINDFSEI